MLVQAKYFSSWLGSLHNTRSFGRSDGRLSPILAHGSLSFQERNQASSSGGLSEQERREKKTLEKKLLEMEEELRVRRRIQIESGLIKADKMVAFILLSSLGDSFG